MINKRYLYNFFVAVTAGVGLLMTGCESATSIGSTSTGDVTIQFATTGVSTLNAKAAGVSQMQQTNDTLTLEGSNGKLIISDIRFIVEDFELERSEGECADSTGTENENCEEFESDPFFVDLPLTADTLNLNTSAIEPGLYEELEFEIDDLDLDEEGDDDQTVKQELANLIRNEFPDWPDEASMVIIGSFVSTQGDTTEFLTYAEAEVEIEMEFNPPLEIGENTVDQLLRVNINPVNWFLRNDGLVVNLSEYDYSRTGNILEFEFEIESGFEGIDIEDDDDEDDDDEEDDD